MTVSFSATTPFLKTRKLNSPTFRAYKRFEIITCYISHWRFFSSLSAEDETANSETLKDRLKIQRLKGKFLSGKFVHVFMFTRKGVWLSLAVVISSLGRFMFETIGRYFCSFSCLRKMCVNFSVPGVFSFLNTKYQFFYLWRQRLKLELLP